MDRDEFERKFGKPSFVPAFALAAFSLAFIATLAFYPRQEAEEQQSQAVVLEDSTLKINCKTVASQRLRNLCAEHGYKPQ